MRRAAVVAGLALLPVATARGGDEDRAAGQAGPSRISAAPAAGVVPPAGVEVIAELTGCEPGIRIEADEPRQGLCHTPEVDYLVTTFPEERYKQTWPDSAAGYGGKYLVGSRRIVSAKEPETLEEFRTGLGGTVQQLRGIGPVPSAS
ncbi:hypothetical protein [Streptomyces sp. H51]|uniref:hypothetical protein n=1 Tax=Streptomyces sp. H51 TaxID=3111770 RepID=UPI002D77628F|nr:hypothetical protein [Streptomyces sp. H51]